MALLLYAHFQALSTAATRCSVQYNLPIQQLTKNGQVLQQLQCFQGV